MRRDDEDDRAGGQSWIDHVVIPDDISALDGDVRALRRQRRAQARRARLRRLASPRGMAGPLVVVVLLMAAGLASLLVLFQPRRPTPSPAPASSGSRPPPLPDVEVTEPDGTSRQLREFRPAVLALAPAGCRCDEDLAEVGVAVVRHGLQFLLVGRTAPALPAGLPAAGTVRLAEPSGALEPYLVDAANGAGGAEEPGQGAPARPVLLLVAVDGQVVRWLRAPITPEALDTELTALRPRVGPRTPAG